MRRRSFAATAIWQQKRDDGGGDVWQMREMMEKEMLPWKNDGQYDGEAKDSRGGSSKGKDKVPGRKATGNVGGNGNNKRRRNVKERQ
jgi:hypothetical protein